MKCVARDGEALIIEPLARADNELNMHCNWLMSTRLPHKNLTLPNGNRVMAGVEIDGLAGLSPLIRTNQRLGTRREHRFMRLDRHSADNIIHLFLPICPSKSGLLWMPSMIRTFHLKKYQEFALVASAVWRVKMGFYYT